MDRERGNGQGGDRRMGGKLFLFITLKRVEISNKKYILLDVLNALNLQCQLVFSDVL